ncbi:MAG: membrane protein insertase YidC [Bacteroidia bacterium]|nr:membrane protein insertase YidC [Bacteroidia bacterium]
MDRNQVIGFVLIAAVLIVFGVLNKPSEEELAARKHYQDSIARLNSAPVQQTGQDPVMDSTLTIPSVNDSLAAEPDTFALASTANAARDEYVIENNLIRLSVSTLGGKISGVELKNYKTSSGAPLLLIDNDTASFGFNFFAQNRAVSTSKLNFTKAYSSEDSLVMKFEAGENRSITLHYSLKPDSYLVGFDVKFHNLHELVAPNTSYMELDWKYAMLQTEKDLKSERPNATPYYMFSADREVESLSYSSSENKNITTRLKWVAFKQHFFTSALIASDEFEKPTNISVEEPLTDDAVKICAASFTIPFIHQPEVNHSFQFYFGPNHYQTLKKIGLNMEQLVNLGFFGFVSKWLVIPVFNWLNSFNLNFGIIILILTILIRIILLPLTYKSFLATAKMRVLQPEVNELNEKFKDDPMKKQQELMGLYRKAGVNPLGGCIPALLQIPILFAMFSFFPTSIELRQESFLWAKDLSTYDSILDLPFNIPFYGSHVSLFTLLMTVSILLYTSINMQMTAATNPQMKIIMYIMPVMFLGVFNSYSAGLSYYYFLSNLFGLGQQYMFKAFVDEDEIHRKIQENKKKPVKKSSFQERLEKMAKERGYQAPKKK